MLVQQGVQLNLRNLLNENILEIESLYGNLHVEQLGRSFVTAKLPFNGITDEEILIVIGLLFFGRFDYN
jgi:hypothetical protein